MKEREIAIRLFKSPRGHYLMGQALAIASQALRAADHPRKEIHNAEDMERLGTLFEPFFSMELADPNPVHIKANYDEATGRIVPVPVKREL